MARNMTGKRALILCLALMLTVCLAACGGKGSEASPVESTPESSVTSSAAEGGTSEKAAASSATEPGTTEDAAAASDTGNSSTENTAASSADTTTEAAPAADAAAGEKYTDEGTNFAIHTPDLPENYPLIPHEQFVAGFKALTDGTITTSSSYSDVASAFGDDGIRMDGIKNDGYAYYSWYSDQDYTGETKVHVLVTFKVDGDQMTYYAYSSEGIAPQDAE